MLKKVPKTKIFKISARLLLIIFAMHVLSVHSLAESLVYCFENNGDVNVETTAALGILFSSEAEAHENDDHDHEEEAVFHQDNDDHRDVPISLLCAKEDKLNRFDQQKTVADLKRAVFQNSEITPASRSLQQTIFLPPVIENAITTNLQTVVLLN
ncbi:MAG: hypothetical protein MK198_13585 [Gracilimonas sp.]|uniref:hypothetical protein n=1 Tax=Gracilimonas sp. TaxID=1974203 RepID=UPI0037515B6C|nr:hypothetical protein [Gracilimonas sp.]